MTTGIQCQADQRREVPAPPQNGICRCHAQQVKKPGAIIHRLSFADRVRPAWSREPGKELEP